MSEHLRKIIIDTDAGIDDAQAILMALNSADVEVIAITTVHGNTTVKQVGRNVLRLLKVANRLDIPVFSGSDRSIMGHQVVVDENSYHGRDGFGDVPDTDPPDEHLIRSETGVNALIRLSKEYKGELTLIALGPLTNLAVALKNDPEFGTRLKGCFIMGGNYYGRGNVTPCAEFNFHSDPEGAAIVLEQIKCDVTLVGWEVCEDNGFSWDEYDEIRSLPCRANTFLKEIYKYSVQFSHDRKWETYLPADEFCMAAFLNPCDVIIETKHVFATVEVQGKYTYGQMVVDWQNILKREPNVHIVSKLCQSSVFKSILRITGKNT